ncbi:interleukin-4 receptor subunit alpha [Spea bombifrons]|uniref:interleukin-4 receptor subunit alpha n=1 Tax=Spea bombifrons TaxID=233779 RepID=UPI00234AE3A7|nr:interleukin-4 receptor subunit alpha [Spea bombifrons]
MKMPLKFPGNCIMKYISFPWLLMLWCEHCDAHLDLKVKNFDCFNDYEKHSFCSWEVVSTPRVNCSEEFLLTYVCRNDTPEVIKECVPENARLDDSALPIRCICHLEIYPYLASIVYDVELKSHGELIDNTAFPLMQKVKPKTPSNLTIDISDAENIMLAWDTGYNVFHYLHDYLYFQLQITSKENQNVVENTILNQKEARHEINKRQFKRGHQYTVKVRSMPHSEFYNGSWSEWSQAAEWYNDYSPSVEDLMKMIIPVVTIVILLLLLSYYFGIKHFKKKWLDETPDPAKSKLFVRKQHMQQKLLLHSEWNHNRPKQEDKKQNGCGNWFYKLMAKVPTEYDLYVSDTLCPVLQPETTTIEKEFEVYSVENEKHTDTCVLEEAVVEEDGGPEQIDESVESTLLKIVAESDFMFEELMLDKVDNHESPPASSSQNGFSIIRGLWQLENTQVDIFENSLGSGYHSYEGDNSPAELQNKPGQLQLCNFNEFPWGWDNLQSNAPMENLENSSHVCQPVTRMDSGYSTFANVVSGSEDPVDRANSTSPALSWDVENFPVSSLINSNHHLQPHAEYYNRSSSLLLPKVSPYKMYNQITLKPNQDQFSHSNPDDCKYEDEVEHDINNTYPSPTQEWPGYQSFSKVFQQEGQSVGCPVQSMDCTVLDSGYKSFNCLLNENKTEVGNDNSLFDVDMPFGEAFQKDIEPANISFDNYDETNASNEPCFGFPNVLFSEVCMDESKNPSYTMDSSEQMEDDGSKITAIKNNTTMNSQDENIGKIPYALTFDICNHLCNLANLYGDNLSLGKLKSKGLVDFNLNDRTGCVVSYCPDEIFSCLSASGSATMEDELSFIQFLKEPKQRGVKFENMSYFFNPYRLKTLLSDTREDSNVMPTNLLVSHKVLDKDGNSYMKLALSNTQHLESICTANKC